MYIEAKHTFIIAMVLDINLKGSKGDFRDRISVKRSYSTLILMHFSGAKKALKKTLAQTDLVNSKTSVSGHTLKL